MRNVVLALVLGVVVTAGSSSEARAQGFGVYEHGACSMAMAGAAVASPCDDGSAIFFNPAALAMQRETVLGIGATLIGPGGDFINDTTGATYEIADTYQPVPTGYFAWPLGKNSTLGLGLFAPYGLTTEWDAPDTFEGRFLAYKASLAAIYIQPTWSYRFNDRFSIGVGFDFSRTDLELNQRLDLSVQPVSASIPGLTFGQLGVPPQTDFGDIQIKGHAYQFGANLGVLMRPSDRFSVGVRYMTKQTVKVDDGEFTSRQILTGFRLPIALGPLPAGTPVDALLAPQFAEGGRLGPQAGKTEVTLPDQFVVGIAITPNDRFKVLFDYQWVNWSLFDELVIDLENGLTTVTDENYDDTGGLRFGAEYRVGKGTFVRGGYIWHPPAAPDETVTPLLPEGERNEFTLGLGQRFGNFQFDFAYQRLNQDDRRGRTIPEVNGVVVNNGVYKFRANLYGAALSWRF